MVYLNINSTLSHYKINRAALILLHPKAKPVDEGYQLIVSLCWYRGRAFFSNSTPVFVQSIYQPG
jgi:hypothetical protein